MELNEDIFYKMQTKVSWDIVLWIKNQIAKIPSLYFS